MNKECNKIAKKESKFWKSKPMMMKNSFVFNSSKIVNLNEKILYNSKNATILPERMMWNIIEKSDEKSLLDVCDFLNIYYDKEKNIRINFTKDFLNFMLGQKGFVLSIVNKNDNSLCGVVCVSIENMIVYDKNREFAVPNFMCARIKYRKKGIAETMMNELIRYMNVEKNIQQGLFSSNNKLLDKMQPCSVVRKYYCPINYNKLLEAGFVDLSENKEKEADIIHKKFAISSKDISENYVLMKEEHIDKVYDLYNIYMSQYNISCKYTKDELKKILLNDVVKSYVIIEDGEKDKIVDFVSYCQVQYRCKDNKIINAGHIFLYTLLKEYSESMMTNLIKLMNNNNIDIVITNDDSGMIDTIMSDKYGNEDSDIETYEKVYEHKFLKKRKIYINLFNWECPFLTPDKMCLFMI